MRFNDITEFAFAAWKRSEVSTPICLLGAPGIGKSSIAPEVAARMTSYVQNASPAAAAAVCEVIDLSGRLPEDIGGIPYRGQLGDMVVAEYGVQKWLARLCQEGVYGILLLDDLPAAAPAVQVAVRQLVLDRTVSENKLSDGIMIMVTGNRREDKSGASTLPAHFRNSVCLLDVDTDVETWCQWYGQQAGQAPIIASFLRYRPNLHSTLPRDADKRGAFATPRTWAKLGRLFEIAQDTNNTIDVASGLVGEGPAIEFLAFVQTRSQLVDPVKVLLDPEKAVPNPRESLASPDRLYAMTTGIGEVAGSWRSGKNADRKRDAPLMFMRALGHVTSGQREYVSTGVSTYTSNGGGVSDLITASRNNMTDPLVKAVIDFLHKTFNQ